MRVVLHICCGICAIPVLQKLTEEGHQISGFFYNPNIHPAEEYHKRLSVTQKVCHEFGVPLDVSSYEPALWLRETLPLKDEPEGGVRCPVCFRIRLEKTYQHMFDISADIFATTLTASRHKPTALINFIGQNVGGERFFNHDFKKDNNPAKTSKLIRQWQLYTQKYCGCTYSLQESKYRSKT